MHKDDTVRLRHMLDAAREAASLDRLWDTAKDDLPPLILQLEQLIAQP